MGDNTYSWDTLEGDNYIVLDQGIGDGQIGGSGLKTIISKDGLLQANNAVIYGDIFASDGWFKGSVSADSGYFNGKIESQDAKIKGVVCATTLYVGNK